MSKGEKKVPMLAGDGESGVPNPIKEDIGKKHDHKTLGLELDLFCFSDLVGSGLPLWTPKGTLLRNLLDDYVWELRKARGYEQVDIPHLTKKELYETSGHWGKFKDELFKIETREKHLLAVKPMNCPHHTQIYARRQWSYRELPQRYASTTKVYRDEQTGELAGISRVRAITQDDAHVFCRNGQVKDEVKKIYEIIKTFYSVFDISLRVCLSIWDAKKPENYLGTKEVWQTSIDSLEHVLSDLGEKDFEWGVGEAAFYGPKIDFMGKDSLGREWQIATIQLDMNMPERFDLTCINENGEKERIVMIHAAIMGSIERFLAILIEHYAGAFPLWLAPVQARILAISEKQDGYAEEVFKKLRTVGIRAEKALSDETLGKRIRGAQIEKIPYVLIVGDKEIKSGSVSARHLTRGDEGTLPIDELLKKLSREIANKG